MPKPLIAIACLAAALLTLSYGGNSLAAEARPNPGKSPHVQAQQGRETIPAPPSQRPSRQCTAGVLAPRVPRRRQGLHGRAWNEPSGNANGFAVCYPQEAKDYEGTPHWNAQFKIGKTDDIGFLSELAVYLKHGIDWIPIRPLSAESPTAAL